MTNPKPPTRLTVSGGPKATPRLMQASPQPRLPMAHPVEHSHWRGLITVAAIVALAILITLVFDGGVR